MNFDSTQNFDYERKGARVIQDLNLAPKQIGIIKRDHFLRVTGETQPNTVAMSSRPADAISIEKKRSRAVRALQQGQPVNLKPYQVPIVIFEKMLRSIRMNPE